MEKKRAIDAWCARHHGLTFKEVGQSIDPPVSANRARQLYLKAIRIVIPWIREDIGPHLTLEFGRERIMKNEREGD